MQINVSGLFKEIGSSIRADGDIEISSIEYRGDSIGFLSPIKVDATVTNGGDYLLLEGRMSSLLLLKCSRCLRNFRYDLNADFKEKLSNRQRSANADDDTVYFTGDVVKLDQIIVSDLLLSLPMRFLCGRDCAGIPGYSAEESDSGEDKGHMNDPRFDVLRELLKTDKEV